MRTNKRKLYESIMKDVSKIINNHLNETLTFNQIKNKLNSTFNFVICSNSPFGSGNKKELAIKAFDEFINKLEKINK